LVFFKIFHLWTNCIRTILLESLAAPMAQRLNFSTDSSQSWDYRADPSTVQTTGKNLAILLPHHNAGRPAAWDIVGADDIDFPRMRGQRGTLRSLRRKTIHIDHFSLNGRRHDERRLNAASISFSCPTRNGFPQSFFMAWIHRRLSSPPPPNEGRFLQHGNRTSRENGQPQQDTVLSLCSRFRTALPFCSGTCAS